MANCNKLFKDFNDELSIPSLKRKQLMRARDNVRSKISDYFEENYPDYKPSFWIQGSYKMKTSIRTKDDTCDLDDGVYFFKEPDITAKSLQKRVLNAVKGITSTDPIHKNKCLRVIYKNDFHIDLPVYWRENKDDDNENSKLAVRDNGFEESDPKKFIDWFSDLKDDDGQLVRIIKYLKAWVDHVGSNLPSGLAISLLACYQIRYNDRDDIALLNTLQSIRDRLKWNWVLKMPTCPYDDLFALIDDDKKEYIIEQLDSFISDATEAISEHNELEASKLWQNHLGKRFPEGKDEDTEAKAKALFERASILSASPHVSRLGQVITETPSSKSIPDTKNYGGQK
ncbi:MAG: hypothetical protein JJU35_11170 [Balneolales bacterium]|nr:hypothetical protein [Balneolales bacterium]